MCLELEAPDVESHLMSAEAHPFAAETQFLETTEGADDRRINDPELKLHADGGHSRARCILNLT